MSEDEVSELVSKIISEVGAQDMKDMGKVMGSLKPLISVRQMPVLLVN